MRPKNVDFDNENICSNYRIQTTLLVIVTPYLKNAKYGVKIRTGHKICSKSKAYACPERCPKRCARFRVPQILKEQTYARPERCPKRCAKMCSLGTTLSPNLRSQDDRPLGTRGLSRSLSQAYKLVSRYPTKLLEESC